MLRQQNILRQKGGMKMTSYLLCDVGTSGDLIAQPVLLGLGTVFVGLIAIIAILSLIRAVVSALTPKKKDHAANETTGIATADGANIADDNFLESNRDEITAAVAVAIAEYIGKDVEGLRIRSIKRV